MLSDLIVGCRAVGRSGVLRTQKLRASVHNPEFKGSSIKTLSRSEYSHACFAYYHGFSPLLNLSSRSIQFFLVLPPQKKKKKNNNKKQQQQQHKQQQKTRFFYRYYLWLMQVVLDCVIQIRQYIYAAVILKVHVGLSNMTYLKLGTWLNSGVGKTG